ncbi:MAG: galactokinase [Clostridia bacterium]|nr:galactokinase [Clostridia bacterium]
MSEKIAGLKKKFIEIYGGEEADLRVFASPGRVNLIGEHIDYCGGYVFPAAITLDSTVIARKRTDRTIRLAATDLPDRVAASLDHLEDGKSLKWGNYQLGVADELQKAGYKLTGVDMLFHDTVPLGSGLSSSAAIQLATAITLVTLGNEEHKISIPIDNVQLAVISQRAEHNFIGVKCGIMDQFASAMGRKDQAMLLDCGTLNYKYTPLKLDGYRIVLANTKKKRGLGESKYNERVSETSEGLAILKQFLPEKVHLCDVTIEEFEKYKEKIIDPIIRKRVEHVVYENARVLKSFDALQSNDLKTFAVLLKEAHASIRDLYEVTGFELDTMVEEALKVEGCIGARMTGAGFGGCTVNIVKEANVEDFIKIVGEKYSQKTGLTPEFYVCDIGEGSREII